VVFGELLTKCFVVGIQSGDLTFQLLFTVSGFTAMTPSGDECLGHSIETKSLGLPTSPFLFDLLDYEITLTTEFFYRVGLSAKLRDIGRMRRCKPDDHF